MAENLDPNIMYLEWSGSSFPNSSLATFKAPAGSTIDWGDGTVETFDADSTQVNTHTYNDGTDNHLIRISGVTSIGDYAFGNCISLTSVVIGDSVTSIGDAAFMYCSRLTSIEVSADNTAYQSIDGNLYTKDGNTLIQYAIGKTATSFSIPDSVTSIGDEAFRNCSSLTSVVIPDSVTSIGDAAFMYCSNLASVKIPDSVTSIGGSAFTDCSSLTSIEIPNGVTWIGSNTFAYCSNLTSVEIPDSVTSIGGNAFGGCTSLTNVAIPDSVTSIGDRAFADCSRLTSIMVFPITPPKLFSSSIPSTIQSIYVQKSSAEAYKKSSRWSSFADKIVGNTTYLSFVRFNQANKKYIDSKISALESRITELESKLNG